MKLTSESIKQELAKRIAGCDSKSLKRISTRKGLSDNTHEFLSSDDKSIKYVVYTNLANTKIIMTCMDEVR